MRVRHRVDPQPRLQPHRLLPGGGTDDERRAEDRMAGEGQLLGGGEDPDPGVTVAFRRQHGDRLGQVQLARGPLQQVLGHVLGVGEHRQLVAFERRVGEDIEDHVRPGARRVAHRLLMARPSSAMSSALSQGLGMKVV
jgi:hypothetical protein